MPRLIDADEAYKVLTDYYHQRTEIQHKALKEALSRVPTVDAEPVVRCDDCIYRDGKTPGQPNILCWQMHVDDFCSYGTKREVGTYCEDIVSVVRCKDCKYCSVDRYADGNVPDYVCIEMDCGVDAADFCSRGVRREDDYEEPDINPCRGCEDYDGKGGCLSHGGCGERKEDETD